MQGTEQERRHSREDYETGRSRETRQIRAIRIDG